MNKYLLSCFLLFDFFQPSFSQTKTPVKTTKVIADTSIASKKAKERFEKLASMAYFPVINAGLFSGVIPVTGVDEVPDPKREYKLLFEFTLDFKDSTNTQLNPGLVEIARIINLHAASGIPLTNIHPIMVVHGPSLFSIRNNQTYQQKFKKDNPNSKLIDEMMKNGVKLIACGQAMNFLDVKKEELYPGVKVSLTAQTVLSNYIGQGYVLYGINSLK